MVEYSNKKYVIVKMEEMKRVLRAMGISSIKSLIQSLFHRDYFLVLHTFAWVNLYIVAM